LTTGGMMVLMEGMALWQKLPRLSSPWLIRLISEEVRAMRYGGTLLNGSAFVAGWTASENFPAKKPIYPTPARATVLCRDFPVKNAAQMFNLGYSPGFVTKLRGN
jgi:hypothetical protein